MSANAVCRRGWILAGVLAMAILGVCAPPLGAAGDALQAGNYGDPSKQPGTIRTPPTAPCVQRDPYDPHADTSPTRVAASGPASTYHDPKTPVPTDVKTCDVAITKTAPAAVELGATIPYSVTVTNIGTVAVALDDLHVTDPTLTAAELVRFAAAIGDLDALLEPGEAWEYRLPGGGALTALATSCSPVQNTASVKPVPAETSLGNNTATVSTAVGGPACLPPPAPPLSPAPPAVVPGPVLTGQPTPADARLTITKRAPGQANARRNIPFQITVQNVGTTIARDVVVSDRLPGGTSLLRRPKGATVRSGVVRWRVGDLAPGQKLTVGLYLRSDTSRSRRLCNRATADTPDAPLVAARRCTRLIRVVGGAAQPPRVTG